ncbi:hypothetical protein AX17_001462 [Amanita inopinata Kibby_2008]|nr:hypothetical protein AX17_001462 [Amanita inopinata Kibby_2008]
MLVGGSECGPSNPLQNLSKRFDQDRGLQQDHFGIIHAGPSQEIFRTQVVNPSASSQEAAHFFASASSPAQHVTAPTSFDLSALRGALPMPQIQPSVQIPQMPQNPVAAWATDFVENQKLQVTESALNTVKIGHPLQHDAQMPISSQQAAAPVLGAQRGLQWNSGLSGFRLNPMHAFNPSSLTRMQAQHTSVMDEISWDKEFTSQELHMTELSQESKVELVEPHVQQPTDELARTAALLLDQVKHEQNPKFQNSQFMDLMRQLRDGKVVVEGNQMVESDGKAASQIDVKGKGRAIDNNILPANMSHIQMASFKGASPSSENQEGTFQEDGNDAYFRQENEDYKHYWTGQNSGPLAGNASHLEAEWDKLQEDWDHFEATASGIKAVDNYQFQSNNPYLLGDSSRLQMSLAKGAQSTFENVLELEAAVQRDMNNATAWYQLGVRQQENEREHKALQALQRSVELDPTNLPTWLALAISYTNDNNRQGAYDSILEWVDRNERYKTAVYSARAQITDDLNVSLGQRYDSLIDCLIAMARSSSDGEIDADIQIALAVLLNANEDYGKAQDCFKTALAVRPDDWLLYNRVGATMANNGRAGEALQYYYRALELNPGYIRARFNLGISCINLRRYEEAAQHILDALVLQENDGSAGAHEKRGVTSSALWDSLKTTCLHMQRIDLATLCDKKDVEGFRLSFSNA